MWTIKITYSQIENRMDVRYYHPNYIHMMDSLKKAPFPIKELRKISNHIVSGATPKAKGEAYTSKDKGIPFIRSGDITDENTVDYDNVLYITREVHESMLKRSRLSKGHILVAIVGATIGKVSMFLDDRNANINQALALVRIKNRNVNPYYVRYFLGSKYGQFQLDKLKRPVARANINCEEVGLIKIPIPPREIQSKIVEIMQSGYKKRRDKLDRAGKILDSINDIVLEELEIRLPEIKEWKTFSRRHSMLEGRFDVFYHQPKFTALIEGLETGNYGVNLLDEFIQEIRYGASLKAFEVGKTPFLTIQNLKEGELDVSKVLYIRAEDRKELSKSSFVKTNDLLISRSGTIGLVAVVPKEADHFAFGSYMIKISLDHRINPKYAEVFLNCDLGKLQTQRLRTGGLQTNLTIPAIKSIRIPFPPKEVQEKIVEKVKQIREEARRLRMKADEVIRNSKQKVEQVILEGNLD